MRVECWHIHGGGFHFGDHGLDQEETRVTLASDSLFSALLARLAETQGQAALQAWMAPFLAGSPPFRLSSTFPYAGKVRLFPRPEAALRSPNETSAAKAAPRLKDLKKVAYLSEALFRRVLAGERLADLYPAALKLQGGKALIDPSEKAALPDALQQDEAAPIWKKETSPRVTLGRGVQNSALYFTGRVWYAPGCGLWFGLAWEAGAQARLGEQLAGLLADLAAAGLGAERSAGYGACQIDPAEVLDLPLAAGAPWVSLSRYLPRPEELPALQWEAAAYTVQRVGGWIASQEGRGQRRRPLNLLAEGATLGGLDGLPVGRIADVQPVYDQSAPLGHPVYRSGLAFPVAIQLPTEANPT